MKSHRHILSELFQYFVFILKYFFIYKTSWTLKKEASRVIKKSENHKLANLFIRYPEWASGRLVGLSWSLSSRFGYKWSSAIYVAAAVPHHTYKYVLTQLAFSLLSARPALYYLCDTEGSNFHFQSNFIFLCSHIFLN